MFVRNNSGQMVTGRVVREPEFRTFDSGKSKAGFSILYGEDPANKDEQGRPRGLFLNVDAWGAAGRDACLLQKGDYIQATGRVEQREYNGKTYTTLIADAIWADLSTIMRLVVRNMPMDEPGNNSGYLPPVVESDPFSDYAGGDGDLPF